MEIDFTAITACGGDGSDCEHCQNQKERLDMLTDVYRQRNAAFSSTLPSLWKNIGTHGIMTLSTCSGTHVTSRPMSVIVIDGKFYCQTDENYLKCRQLQENPNAALCYKNFSIEGICCIIGKPFQHHFFVKAMNAHFPDAAARWSALPTECVLAITPGLIRCWTYENNRPCMEYWDFQNQFYRREWQ